MDQIIKFDKSLQTRLQEYDEVFSGSEALPFSKIQSEWAYYLELTIDPLGWQAIWKISRLTCETLKIPFPTVVLVYVFKIDYPKLTARVKILAVQDDSISLPEKHWAPLTQLWPTREQDRTFALNINLTANILDMLRFFYINIVRPWDEDDDASDWKVLHLEERLRLHYDLMNGKIPKHTAEHIFALLNEARRINNKRRVLVDTCDSMDSDVEETNDVISDKNTETLIEYNVRLIEIQNEIALLENEVFRKVIIKRQEMNKEDNKESLEASVWLIFKKGQPNQYVSFLQKVQTLYPNREVIFATDFMKKLETANLQDTILLNESEHLVRAQGAIIEGFTIRGVGNKEKTKVVSEAEEVMFDCIGDNVHFEKLTMRSKSTPFAILVRRGKVVLENCNIFGNKCASTLQGILVLAGAELVVKNCEMEGFYLGIVGNSHSKITIENTKINGAYVGIKVYDECELNVNNIDIRDCQQYGILFEIKNEDMEGCSDVVEELNKLPKISILNSNCQNNGKCDYKVVNSKINAMDNLFENPDVDPSIQESDGDEMDQMDTSVDNVNNTVIEVSAGEEH